MLGEIENTGGAKFAYTWGADGLVSRRNLRDSVTEWYHFGAQGETRAITNIAGQVISTYSYDAYGNPFCSSEPGETNPFKYGGKVGYYSEGGAGLILAGARWYSPNLRRWISRDPIRYEGGVHLYEYVGGRPVRYIDPSGLGPIEWMVDMLVNLGEGVTGGYVEIPRRYLGEFLNGESDFPIVSDTPAARLGDVAGEVVLGGLCGGLAGRALGRVSYLKKFRFINSNRYLRVGPGRMPANGGLRAGTNVPRIAIGPDRPNLPAWWQRRRHIDLRIRPFDR
ncbi:MAG: RHS repeat-associated core domain-containing protein [Deltaproteobacteria bacterium]|nr:RHS repeat-associated core domain-containing protein [Deltaproteobacteria bacterium]